MTADVYQFDPLVLVDPAECPACGRDSGCADDCPKLETVSTCRPMVETAAEFMARVASMPPARTLLGELWQADASLLLHGQPRGFKTVSMEEIALAGALGDAPFGLERFRPERPLTVWYVGEEDGERPTLDRFRLILAGRGLSEPPANLHVSVRAGVNLDDPDIQGQFMEHGKRIRPDITMVDPLRAITGGADQGPRELRPFGLFMRRYMLETGSAFGMAHHDTKPMAGKPDDRAKPQRASGGGVFSISDCPVSVERMDARRSLVVPSSYKFTDDPKPFIVTMELGDGYMRLLGEDVAAEQGATVALHERVLEFLRHSPGSTGNAVARNVTGAKGAILRALSDLEEAGKVDSVENKRAVSWFVRGQS